MRGERQTNEQILEAAATRGLAFEVDREAEMRLRRMRFTTEDVERFKQIRLHPPQATGGDGGAGGAGGAEPDDHDAGAAGGAAGPRPAAGGGEGQRDVNPDAPFGPRKPDAWHDQYLKMATDMARTSGLNIGPHETANVILWASNRTARAHVGDLNRLQQILAQQYGGLFASGLDKRSAHLVLIDNDYDYQAYVVAMFKVFEENGVRFQGQDPVNMARQAAAFSTGNISVINLGKVEAGERSKAILIYQAGRMFINHLTEGRATDAITCGFGNVCEVIMYNKPSATTQSYDLRQLEQAGEWVQIVRQRMRANEAAAPSQIIRNYSTDSMNIPQFAEAWSLIQSIATVPGRFEKAVKAIRDGGEPFETILQIYEMDEQKWREHWAQTVR